jgi:DNA-binding CsgD family transcriptional regulator
MQCTLDELAGIELRENDAQQKQLRGRYYVTTYIGADTARFVDQNPGRLTPRQREVLQLVADGNTSKEIAALLKITPKTVEFHRKCLTDELGLRNTVELVRYALSHRIIP